MRENPNKTNELSVLFKNKPALMLKFKWYLLRKLVTINRELNWFKKS
jgi:hypothetical protein